MPAPRFLQRDLVRALRAVKAAGVVARVRILADGTIEIEPMQADAKIEHVSGSEWDGVEEVM